MASIRSIGWIIIGLSLGCSSAPEVSPKAKERPTQEPQPPPAEPEDPVFLDLHTWPWALYNPGPIRGLFAAETVKNWFTTEFERRLVEVFPDRDSHAETHRYVLEVTPISGCDRQDSGDGGTIMSCAREFDFRLSLTQFTLPSEEVPQGAERRVAIDVFVLHLTEDEFRKGLGLGLAFLMDQLS